MKLFTKTVIASALVLGSFAVNAATLDSIPGVTAANVNYTVDNGVATLFGSVESKSESKMAERYIAQLDGVDRVINLITHQ